MVLRGNKMMRLLLIAILGMASLGPTFGAEILMIGANPQPTFGDDGPVFDYLTDVLGHEVTYLAGDDATTDDGAGVDLVIISSTLASGAARGKFLGLETPILNWEEALMDGTTAGGNFAMGAGSENGTANPGTQLQILNAAHPLAAGLSGIVELATDPIPRPHVVGPVAPGVLSIASIPVSGLGPVELSPSGFGIHIGSSQTGASPFTGLMDEVAIWDRGLSFQVDANNTVIGGDVHTIFTQGIPALGNNPGMIGYWSFDDTDDADLAVDMSGSGNDALLEQGAFKVDDDRPPVGGAGALLLDGTNLVNVPDIERPGGELAYSFWFKADSGVYGPEFDTADPRVDFIYGNGNGGTVRPHLSANRNGRPIGLYVNADGDLATPIETSVSAFSSDEWHHVVITWDGEIGSVFVDGVLSVGDESDLFGITAVDIGGELSDGTFATQRIVNFPIQDVGFASLTDDGLALFTAAVDWLLGAASVPGDFNGDGVLDLLDLDDLTSQSASNTHPLAFDLNGDSFVNDGDITIWVKELYKTWIGDADLNGEFNSSDLVTVLAAGTYETGAAAVWSTGDFDGDGLATSSDLVAGLADGGYEQGPLAGVAAVPEPHTLVLTCLAACAVFGWSRRRSAARH
jgi:hypothetical protein